MPESSRSRMWMCICVASFIVTATIALVGAFAPIAKCPRCQAVKANSVHQTHNAIVMQFAIPKCPYCADKAALSILRRWILRDELAPWSQYANRDEVK